jgi:hypothetical protein
MSILSTIFGSATASPITAIGNVLDSLFTSDDEKLGKKILMERLLQEPQKAQTEINQIEASHRSIFVAGWRPFIGWVCGIGLFYDFVFRPIVMGFSQLDSSTLGSLVLALLGLGGIRTIEKLSGRSK